MSRISFPAHWIIVCVCVGGEYVLYVFNLRGQSLILWSVVDSACIVRAVTLPLHYVSNLTATSSTQAQEYLNNGLK